MTTQISITVTHGPPARVTIAKGAEAAALAALGHRTHQPLTPNICGMDGSIATTV